MKLFCCATLSTKCARRSQGSFPPTVPPPRASSEKNCKHRAASLSPFWNTLIELVLLNARVTYENCAKRNRQSSPNPEICYRLECPGKKPSPRQATFRCTLDLLYPPHGK